MHRPPSDREKYIYVHQNKTALYSAGILSFLCLAIGMILFAISQPGLFPYLIFVVLLFSYLGISYFIGIFGESFSLGLHEILKAPLPKVPSVDVYLPSCGEPLDILENTFIHVAELNWETKKVYVLDDKGSGEVEYLSRRYGFNYISRPNKGELKKAGNIRHAFAKTAGDFILILDADFAPRRDMLEEMIPYFFFEDVAIVQSPQYFTIEKEHSWVQKGAAYIQELFYRLIQVNRNTWGASICVGTNALYRRKALEPFGGTAPIAYSEDLHTGFMLLRAGWKVVYLPINLAKGICPSDKYSFFVQQYRWCLGSFSLFLNPEFWQTKLPVMVRLCYLSGMGFYIAAALGIFLTPLPGIFMVWFASDKVFWYNLIFSVPSFVYGTFGLAIWGRAPWGLHALTVKHLSHWAYFFAILDKIRAKTLPWVPTGASGSQVARYKTFKILFSLWSFGVYAAVMSGTLVHMNGWTDYNFYPIIFFSTFHTFICFLVATKK